MDFFQTTVSQQSKKLSSEVLESTFLSTGKVSIEFQRELEKSIGARNPVALNSGTSSLHLGLHLMDLKKGDEVILPAQTFLASGLTILMTGAKPVFCDINYFTGNICTNSLQEKIESYKNTAAWRWATVKEEEREMLALAIEQQANVKRRKK